MTKILQHSCENSYQDQIYGKNNRVFNEGKAHYTCTNCGAKIPRDSSSIKKTKGK